MDVCVWGGGWVGGCVRVGVCVVVCVVVCVWLCLCVYVCMYICMYVCLVRQHSTTQTAPKSHALCLFACVESKNNKLHDLASDTFR